MTASATSRHRRARLLTLALAALACKGCLLATTATAQVAPACNANVFPTSQLRLAAGEEVGYRLECNFVIGAYAVGTGDRIGIPRAREITPGNMPLHDPMFVCGTASGGQANEFSCQHGFYFPSPPASLYGTGWWQITRGVRACDPPQMRWNFVVYNAAKVPQVDGSVGIDCRQPAPVPAPPSAPVQPDRPPPADQPVQPGASVLAMTDTQARSYLRRIIRDNTSGSVSHLRSSCHRASYRSFLCRPRWRIGRHRYSGRARFAHEFGAAPRSIVWSHAFEGRRRTPGCRRCTRLLRW